MSNNRLNATNNAQTELSENISSTDTSFGVQDASVFPAAPFRVTIEDGEDREVVEVESVTDNVFDSVVRGVENFGASSWDAGSAIDHRFTAGTLAELIGDFSDADSVLELADGKSLSLRGDLNLNSNDIVDVGNIEGLSLNLLNISESLITLDSEESLTLNRFQLSTGQSLQVLAGSVSTQDGGSIENETEIELFNHTQGSTEFVVDSSELLIGDPLYEGSTGDDVEVRLVNASEGSLELTGQMLINVV